MLLVKSLHILGACLFVGNIIVSAFWKVMADRTRNAATIQYATKLVNLTDMLLTGFGATLIVITGHLLAQAYGGVLSQRWILLGYTLFAISGVLWIAVLVPIQIKQAKLVKNLEETDPVPEQYYKMAKMWSLVGPLCQDRSRPTDVGF